MTSLFICSDFALLILQIPCDLLLPQGPLSSELLKLSPLWASVPWSRFSLPLLFQQKCDSFHKLISLKEKWQNNVRNWSMKMKSVSHSVVSDSCNHIDCSLPGSCVHGILQARILEWIVLPSPGDLPNPGTEPKSPALQVDSLLSGPLVKPWISPRWHLKELQFLWWSSWLLAGDECYHFRLVASQYKPTT